MEHRWKDQLPGSAQALVDRIEDYAGVEIQVRQQPTDPLAKKLMDPSAAGTDLDEKEASIIISDLNLLDPPSMVHELCHIQRFWPDKIPQILPKDPSNRGSTSNIENTIEHVIIAPLEASHGVDPYSRWNDMYRESATRPERQIENEIGRRIHCFMRYLSATHLVTDRAVRQAWAARIRAHGLFDEAVDFVQRIVPLLGNKRATLAFVVRACGIPPHTAILRTYDIKNRRCVDESIPMAA